MRLVMGNVTVRISKCNYPEPQSSFQVSPEVRELFDRYSMVMKDSTLLLFHGYYFKTYLQEQKNRGESCGVSNGVWQKLGTLTSERGDSLRARKADASDKPLSPQEEQWIRVAMREIVIRAGQKASGNNPSPLNLGDLPTLT